MDSAANSTMLMVLFFSRTSFGSCFFPMNTFKASGRRRAPLHTSHGSSPKKYLVPRPLHSGHAPYGELNEKSRGSTSGKENPSYGHINFAETTFSTPCGSVIFASPPD